MTNFFKKTALLSSVVICLMTTVSWAEEAPVYDVDNFAAPDAQTAPQATESASSDSTSDQASASDSKTNETVYLSEQQRLARLEQQISNLQQTISANKMEELQNSLQALRGQVEEMVHTLQQVQTQQRTMYSDLDKRVSHLVAEQNKATRLAENETKALVKKTKENIAPAATTPIAQKNPNEPNVQEEQQTYQIAYDLIKVKKYNEAIAALQGMLKKYPSGQFAANAHYWLGELYGLIGQNNRSAAEFSIVVKEFPQSPKVSDAQLKLGFILASTGKWNEAKSAFKTVINRYPGTAPARLASQQLKQMKGAGH